MAAGLFGASLLLSPLTYAEEGTQGSTMTEGHHHKAGTKTTHAKKHKAKKGTTTTEKTPEKAQ
jgi:hypothetical protein